MVGTSSNHSDPNPCEVCSFIPSDLWANTGGGESLATELGELVCLDLDTRNDLYACPSCEALFEWADLSQLSGSGNNDEERLTRLSPEQTATARALLDPDPGERDGEQLLQQAFGTLSHDTLYSILRYRARRHRHAFAAFVRPLVARLMAAPDLAIYGVITSYCDSDRERVAEILGLLDAGGPDMCKSAQYLRETLANQLARMSRLRP